MTELGFDRPLYILSFDQRGLFQKEMFGWTDPLSPEQTAEIVAAKRVIYDAFRTAVHNNVQNDEAAILIDEQFGAATLRGAWTEGHFTACPVEKNGQDEFDFEYGEDFAAHIKAFHPSFCKARVHYNPQGDQNLNQRQSARLKRLSEYLQSDESLSRFMLELVVPAEKAQFDQLRGDKKAYDLEVRPRLVTQAIQQLQDAGVEPDVWGVEGLDRQEDCERIVAAARRQGRDGVGCLILDRGEDNEKVRKWLTTAAAVPGFIGFAVGRTSFWDPLVAWRAKTVTQTDAIAEIARRYHEFVGVFQRRENMVAA